MQDGDWARYQEYAAGRGEADLRFVGVTSDYGNAGSVEDAMLTFGLATHGNFNTPSAAGNVNSTGTAASLPPSTVASISLDQRLSSPRLENSCFGCAPARAFS